MKKGTMVFVGLVMSLGMSQVSLADDGGVYPPENKGQYQAPTPAPEQQGQYQPPVEQGKPEPVRECPGRCDREERGIFSGPMTCALDFNVRGGGFIAILGFYKLRGHGRISCVDAAGREVDTPVIVSIGGSPIELNVAVGYFHLRGGAVGIGVATGPQELFGDYAVVGANATALIGAGAHVTMTGVSSGLNLNVGLNLETGIGAQVGINGMTIEPCSNCQVN